MAMEAEDTGRGAAASLRWARRGAYAALLVEQIWPAVFALLSVAAIFLILSWFGIFLVLPAAARIAILVVLLAGVLLILWRARTIRLPRRDAIERRIEAESRLEHQPLRVQSDRPANADPFAASLWREHQRRMAGQLRNLSAGSPKTRTERLDPFAVRAVLAMLLVTAFAFSHSARGGRVFDAFAAPAVAPLVAGRVDAWVTPPSYTGRAPIFLTDAASGDAAAALAVPEGSILSVRISDGTDASLTFTPKAGGAAITIPARGRDGQAGAGSSNGTAPAAAKSGDQAAGNAGPGQYEYTLAASGSAALSTTFRTLGAWRFDVVADADPTIAFAGEPSESRKGALELAYTVADDYGVRQGRLEIAVQDGAAKGARPLVAAPTVNLAMPRRAKGEAKGRTSTDLSQSPYAGATVAMTLVVSDDAGQVGRSETKTVKLPERRFTNPLARAVVEQRRILALDANETSRVMAMLDAVTLRGEDFIQNPSDYLALTAVRSRIANAHDDATLLSAVDFMWDIALGIEDGNLSLAERKLRDAREQLSQALEKGASDAEIDKLMQELRQAMQEYMQAMAEAAKSMPPMSREELESRNTQEIRPSDLERMMDQIESLAKSGSKDAAKQLLSELQKMMDNMQVARPGQPPQGGGDSAMRQEMDKLGEILRKQQALKDKTFDLGREQMRRQDGDPQEGENGQGQPMTPEELQKRLGELRAAQEQLQKELQEAQKALEGMGLKPGEKGLGEAGDAMGRATSALGQGEDGEAVGQQSQAMDALRRGAGDMMRQMQEAMEKGRGREGREGQMGEGFGPGEQRSDRDPLGRPRSTQGADFGQDVKVPDEIDTQRARRILDAIRNRLGDSLSPQLERDYLERLLKTP